MRPALTVALLLAVSGCGRAGLTPRLAVPFAPCPECVDGFFPPDAGLISPAATDAGTEDGGLEDAGVVLPCTSVPFGPDCCAGGTRVTSASCLEGAWACTQGTFCTCEGQPQQFQCSDFCGSDAFLPPSCLQGQWRCEAPLIETSQCAPDTCWGDPGGCCGAPSCVDGGWMCGFKPDGC